MLQFKRINYIELDQYIALAKKGGLEFCNKTEYYGLYDNNKMVAFAGILKYQNKWVFKNAYTIEHYRGLGYHKQFLAYRLNLAKINNIKTIEATCTKMSINNYIKYGFEVVNEYKHYKKLRLNL